MQQPGRKPHLFSNRCWAYLVLCCWAYLAASIPAYAENAPAVSLAHVVYTKPFQNINSTFMLNTGATGWLGQVYSVSVAMQSPQPPLILGRFNFSPNAQVQIPGLPVYLDTSGKLLAYVDETEVFLVPNLNLKLMQGKLQAETSFILGAKLEF